MSKLLIIDDDLELTELLTEFLGKHRYHVVAYLNPLDGLQ